MVAQQNLPTPLLVTDKSDRSGKNPIRKSEKVEIYAGLGECMEEVRNGFGLTLQQFAAELGRNESQIRRQIKGDERPMLEAVFAVERFRAPLVIALAKLSNGVEVVTEIRVRRTA